MAIVNETWGDKLVLRAAAELMNVIIVVYAGGREPVVIEPSYPAHVPR